MICLTTIIEFNLSAEGYSFDQWVINHIKISRKNKNNSLLRSTQWRPNAGVSLLKEKDAVSVWNKFSSKASKCGIRNLDVNIDNFGNYPITSFLVFKTKKLYVFVFEYYIDQPGEHWVICNSVSTEQLFESYQVVPAQLIDPLRSNGSFGGCPAPGAKVRFRRYHKEGPLFLDVHASRCQSGENHYEATLDISNDAIQVVPGSRLKMEWLEDGKLWQWWYVGERYKPKVVKWNDKGEATWTRILGRRPVKLMDHVGQENLPIVLVRQKCLYKQVRSEVKCSYKIIEKAEIKTYQAIGGSELSGDQWHAHAIEKLKDVKAYRDAGFLIDDSEIDELKRIISIRTR